MIVSADERLFSILITEMSAADDGLPSRYFSWVDYCVFGGMLLLSALIGVYFAFFAKQKQNTTNEYLMGGKTMGIFPISMSLIAR
jgi:hypothetical protein